jgi:ketosteroid isomerase-like protein
MKVGTAIAFVGMLAAQPAAAQAASQVEQEVTKVERTYLDATIKKDRATLARIYGDDYMYTHSNGAVMNKAQDIADAVSSDAKWTSYSLEDTKVRVFGDVAVLTAKLTLNGTSKGYVPGPRREIDIFVKRNGAWQLVGGQTALIPAPPK